MEVSREMIACELKDYKDANDLTYQQMADMVGDSSITLNVVQHLINHGNCDSVKAKTIYNALLGGATECVPAPEPISCDLGEQLRMVIHSEKEAKKNPQNMTSLDDEANRLVEKSLFLLGQNALRDSFLSDSDNIPKYTRKAIASTLIKIGWNALQEEGDRG